MFQQTASWDLRSIRPEPSTGLKLYILLLVVAWLACAAKLVRAWRSAPPFCLHRRTIGSLYVEQLGKESTSLNQWIGCVLLCWGIYASIHVTNVCSGLLTSKVIAQWALLFIIQDFSVSLTMALLTAVFLFLVKWHFLRRAAVLRERIKSEK